MKKQPVLNKIQQSYKYRSLDKNSIQKLATVLDSTVSHENSNNTLVIK